MKGVVRVKWGRSRTQIPGTLLSVKVEILLLFVMVIRPTRISGLLVKIFMKRLRAPILLPIILRVVLGRIIIQRVLLLVRPRRGKLTPLIMELIARGLACQRRVRLMVTPRPFIFRVIILLTSFLFLPLSLMTFPVKLRLWLKSVLLNRR